MIPLLVFKKRSAQIDDLHLKKSGKNATKRKFGLFRPHHLTHGCIVFLEIPAHLLRGPVLHDRLTFRFIAEKTGLARST